MNQATLKKMIEDAFAPVKREIGDRVSSLEAEVLKASGKAATSNANPLIDAAEKARVNEIYGGSWAVEALDSEKGKGLTFARTLRCLASADRERKDPRDVAEDWKLPKGLMDKMLSEVKVEKALGESSLGAGGVLTPDQFSMEFIEILRARVVLVNQGVTRIPMTTRTLTISRQAGAAVPVWVGESANITKSEQTFDDIQLTLRKLGCLTPISNDLLRDNLIAADIIVRNDLLAVAVREMDIKAIRGVGTLFSPKGIRNMLTASQIFNSAAAGSPNLTTALKDLNTAVRVVKEGNVPFTKDNAFWIMTPRTEGGYRQYRDQVGRPFFAEEMDTNGTIIGYRYLTTTAVPNNLSGGGSGGSTESELYLIIAPEFYMGEGLAPTIEVARNAAYFDNTAVQSGLSRDETAVSIILRVDFALRHPVSGSVVLGIVDL